MELSTYLVKKIKHYLEHQADTQDEQAEQLLRELQGWEEMEQQLLQPQTPATFPYED